MNKKFSTLVASLLLSSAFSVYAGNAKPMLATPTQVETRATSADVEEAIDWTGTSITNSAKFPSPVLSEFTNGSRLGIVMINGAAVVNQQTYLGMQYNSPVQKVYVSNPSVETAKEFYWQLVNGRLVNNANQSFSLYDNQNPIEVIPLLIDGETSPYFVLGQRDAAGAINYAQVDNTAGFSPIDNLAQATVFCSVETAFSKVMAADDVNAVLGNGFNLSITSAKDEKATVTNAEAFAGDLKAEAASTSGYIYIYNGNKVVAFDGDAEITSDGYSEKGKFVLTDNKTKFGAFAEFKIYKADNGSDVVKVTVNKNAYRLYVANVNSTYGLSVAKINNSIPAENWAVTKLGNNNIVDLHPFVNGQYVNIDFVDGDEAYKKDGRLAILNDEADFVAKAGLYEKAPEAMWAVKAGVKNGQNVWDGTITLVNRENPAINNIVISELRYTDKPGVYEVSSVTPNVAIAEGDYITITSVADHSKTDGYAVFNANDLRNKTWNLGQVRRAEGDAEINVFWAENHGTHQIGATVDEAAASRWNLSLVNKFAPNHEAETDSILVVSELQTWNATKNRIDAKKDTLVILPYAFQNRANNEYVVMNDQKNLEYYICDKDNKEEARYAQRFALKMKADGTYNYVALESFKNNGFLPTYQPNGAVWTKNGKYADNKVFQENSTLLGTWSDMPMYSKDANSIMFVKEATAPEYRKLVAEEGVDVISLYRAENEAQVVYEKADKKSVVEGRTLSFLNIDNVEQFKGINPALYIDTAYVNRGGNTCYQYLLGVNVTEHRGFYCPEHGFASEAPCEHAEEVIYKTGRYLINMIDTANVYGADVNIHNNPYINETEEGAQYAKLSFVDAIHVLKEVSGKEGYADQLYVINNGDTTNINLGTPAFNIAKFAFKYVDSMNGLDSDFKIQTLWKEYAPNTKEADRKVSEEGYLRWVNGCLVVDETYQKGDVFNMNEDETRTPTANEEITAESSVVVAGVNGAVVVKGAEGKSVIVSTILGKVVANEVLTSDNATIAAPAGVVVVSVDGESFKVVVK